MVPAQRICSPLPRGAGTALWNITREALGSSLQGLDAHHTGCGRALAPLAAAGGALPAGAGLLPQLRLHILPGAPGRRRRRGCGQAGGVGSMGDVWGWEMPPGRSAARTWKALNAARRVPSGCSKGSCVGAVGAPAHPAPPSPATSGLSRLCGSTADHPSTSLPSSQKALVSAPSTTQHPLTRHQRVVQALPLDHHRRAHPVHMHVHAWP